MSATMAGQGGRVQLEHSDMCLAWNMAKMAWESISHATIEQPNYLINTPRANVLPTLLRLYQSIPMSSWKNLQLQRCIQNAMSIYL
jgi:hypothetical protein